MDDNKLLVKVLTGSRAHSLANEDSDYDYRGVYIVPTHKIVSLGYKYKGTHWQEGKDDDTSYELGHFLHLATKCNPTILEIFMAPVVEESEETWRLREIFKHAWNPKDSFNAFVGYGHNQRKKFLDKKDDRPHKYASAYLRVLYQLCQLLEHGVFDVDFKDTPIYERLKLWKGGYFGWGEVIDQTRYWSDRAEALLVHAKNPHHNIDKVNGYLIDMRRKYWKLKDKEQEYEYKPSFISRIFKAKTKFYGKTKGE